MPQKIYSVSEVTRDIKNLLEDNFASVWISGEISNLKAAASGHIYFTLKDSQAQIAAVLFRGSATRLKFALEDGLEVIVHGRISVYDQRGQHQIIIDHAEPKGMGALTLAFEQLKKRLSEEGLFDEKHKKLIPYLPRCVGVITSSKGAALHDMVTVLTRRFPNIEILINPVKVQGEGAAEEIAQAIAEMNQLKEADVLIVGRGGGSLEDLWAFNEEVVVRTIFASEIPVISAVGHETDFTLCDLVADLRAPTPSAAAELAVPEKKDLLETVTMHREGLAYAISQQIKSLRDMVAALKRHLKDPKTLLEELKIRIDDLAERLVLAQRNFLSEKRHVYREIIRGLELLSPLAVLTKGYSLVFKEGSPHPIQSASQVKADDLLTVRLNQGSLAVQVISPLSPFEKGG